MFNSAVTIIDQKSLWVKLGKNSQKLGTAESAMVTAGLNAPAPIGMALDEFLTRSILL